MLGVFRILSKMRRLRGSVFDVFGYTEERRGERALIDEYEQAIEALLPDLDSSRLDLAVRIASIPEQIRGFGHVKARHLEAARAQWAELRSRYARRQPESVAV